MSDGIPVVFAEGVKADIAAMLERAAQALSARELEELKRRVASLLVECRTNPYVGDLMGPGRHPELAGCRRVRFDAATYEGKPRFRLVYCNQPSDGAPAECRRLAAGPRAGLALYRQATRRLA